jgi:hypothetical protein
MILRLPAQWAFFFHTKKVCNPETNGQSSPPLVDCGARVVLEAIGPDEKEALGKLELLLLGFRDEERGQN